MKRLLMLFFVFAVIITLNACDEPKGFTYDFAKDKKDPTTITIWVDDTKGQMINEMITEFRKIHPDIYVKFNHMGSVDAMNQLQMSGPSGNGADIFQFPHDQLATALKQELLYALPAEFVDGLTERMQESAIKIATACYTFGDNVTDRFACTGSNEEVFAAPISVESVALFYNKDLLADLGLEPAKSFEELFEQANEFNDINANKYLLNTNWDDSYFINFVLSAFGYQPFGPTMQDADNIGLNTPEVIEALTWLQENIVPFYGVGTNNTAIQEISDGDFESGKTPYIIQGPWKIETYRAIEDFEVGVTTIPTININGKDVQPKPFMGAQMLGVYKHSNNVEAALKFIQFWTSDKGLEIQYKYQGKLPALKEEFIENIPGVKEDEYLAGIIKQLENTIPMPTIPEVKYYWDPVKVMIQDVWKGMSPGAAAEKAENSYEANRNLGK